MRIDMFYIYERTNNINWVYRVWQVECGICTFRAHASFRWLETMIGGNQWPHLHYHILTVSMLKYLNLYY